MIKTHERLLASVSAARDYYLSVIITDKGIASMYLREICQIIETVPPSLAIEWLKEEMRSLPPDAVLADHEFHLDLVEYCVRSLRWKEGKDMLVELFNEMKDFSFRLRLELMIKRFYDPHWNGGDCEFSDLGSSIWDLVERENEWRKHQPAGESFELDAPFKKTHERFQASISATRNYYLSVIITDKMMASMYLREICQIIETVPPTLAIEWLKREMRSLSPNAVLADHEFHLDLVEYCVRSLRWKEGKDMLLELFNEMKDLSFRLKLEVMVKRYYDPNWDGGDCAFTDVGPSIWDRVEQSCLA